MGLIIVTPFLLSWSVRSTIHKPLFFWQKIELFIGMTLLLIVGHIVLSGTFNYPYLMFPFIIWLALRFGMRAISTATLIIATLATYNTIHGMGHFVGSSENESLILLILYIGVIGITGMVLAAVVANGLRFEKALQQANDQLEVRVTERTSELQDALNNIKTLGGLLPICANCKKIRDDLGYWQAVESYIMKHSDATFTHGMCPDCMKEYFPDYVPANHRKPADSEKHKE
ncbi:MAG: MASE1 domain-containing protein [Bacteroidota bacterium]|jgi:hypothetical protein